MEAYPELASIRDIASVEPYPDITSPGDIDNSSPDTAPPGTSVPQLPLHTRSGKAK